MRQPVPISLLVLLVVAPGVALAARALRGRAPRPLPGGRWSAHTHAGRLALVGEIAGAIVHEISQPLSANLTNVDTAEALLGRPDPPVEEIRHVLADIRRDNLRASAIVRHLHALLKRRELQTTRIDLNQVAAAAIDLIQPVARQRDVAVRASLDPTLPPVHADPVHLEQVLLNLMINAMDAMASNTATGAGERILAVATGRHDKHSAAIAVTDTGPGVAAAYRRRIFDSFFSTKRDGLGLGLAIARTIVRAHGGRIWQEETPAGGSAFRFTIPLGKA